MSVKSVKKSKIKDTKIVVVVACVLVCVRVCATWKIMDCEKGGTKLNWKKSSLHFCFRSKRVLVRESNLLRAARPCSYQYQCCTYKNTTVDRNIIFQ